MNMENRYRQIIDRLPDAIRARNKNGFLTAFGYTSDLDILSTFRTDSISLLLEKFLPGEDLAQMQAPPCISSLEDFLRTVVFFCREGIGGEADMADISLIRPYFEEHCGIGGTGVQAALTLSSMGASSLVHLTDDSSQVCALLNKSGILAVDPMGNAVPTGQLCQRNPQEIHYIIQFQKGQVLRSGSQYIVIPASNRLIVTKATVNHLLPLYLPFFRYIEKHAVCFPSIVLSSFNSIQEESILRDRIDTVCAHTQAYRRANPGGLVFFEDAAYHNDGIRRKCMDLLYGAVDIVSMNEEELQLAVQTLGMTADIGSLVSITSSARRLQEAYSIRQGIIIHTKDYALYTGTGSLDFKMLEQGLAYGNVMATAKALTGNYANPESVWEVMQLPMSPKGISFRYQAAEIPGVIVVPSRLIDKPAYTIGLGDSFVAGMQLCF